MPKVHPNGFAAFRIGAVIGLHLDHSTVLRQQKVVIRPVMRETHHLVATLVDGAGVAGGMILRGGKCGE